MDYQQKRKKINREICEYIELGIDKLYLFQLRALEDNILTEGEIIKAKNIINEVKEEIIKIKNNKIDRESLTKLEKSKIEKEIKKE